ncbi:hypothetical protein BTE77_27925 [Ensifer adhaerens]|nr:hypothetical protein BTE77_27925 [Ensifer adhaerens]
MLVAAYLSLTLIANDFDARAATLELYQAEITHAQVLLEIMSTMADNEPKATADRIVREVYHPLMAAKQQWWDAAPDGKHEHYYTPFISCYEAADSLHDFGNKVARYLNRLDKEPFSDDDAQPFRVNLEKCEDQLGLERTFNEVR